MQKHILIHTVYNSNPATSSNKAHTDKVRVGFIATCIAPNPSNPARGWISLRSANVGIRTNTRRKRGFRIPPEDWNTDKVRVGFIATCIAPNPSNPARGWISLRSASVGIRTNIRRKRGFRIPL